MKKYTMKSKQIKGIRMHMKKSIQMKKCYE